MTNAFKFTTSGKITVGYKNTKDGLLYFYVTDTGCGIDKKVQKSIFERFVRLDTSIRGTGLGLSICKLIINRMGGELLESIQNRVKALFSGLQYP